MKNKKLIMISSLVCLIPLMIGLIVYKQLPDLMVMQVNSEGMPLNVLPKFQGAILIPFCIVIVHLTIIYARIIGSKKRHTPRNLDLLAIWVVPILSVVINSMFIFINLGYSFDVLRIIIILLGVLFIVYGNYLPKIRRLERTKYEIPGINVINGIKYPWIQNDDLIWNKTHHLASYLYIVLGLISMLYGILNIKYMYTLFVFIILVEVLIIVYSLLLWKKRKNKGGIA